MSSFSERKEFFNNKYKDRNLYICPNKGLIGVQIGNYRRVRPNCWDLKSIRDKLYKIGDQRPLGYTYSHIGESKFRSEELEKRSLPYFSYVFYRFFCVNNLIPTLNDMYYCYLYHYCEEVSPGIYKFKDGWIFPENENFEFLGTALYGRIYRMINSFYRELDLLYNLSENNPNYLVTYNFKTDVFAGIDFIVQRPDGKKIGIASYLKSKNSIKYKKDKNENRHVYNIPMIDIRSCLGSDNCYDCNSIWLHNDTAIKKLINIIDGF